VDLPLVSIEATGISIMFGISKVLLAVICESQGHVWNDADVTELLSFRHKSLWAGDMSAKHSFWNSIDSKPSRVKLLNLLYINEFEIQHLNVPHITLLC
jgi:hypothetical protein